MSSDFFYNNYRKALPKSAIDGYVWHTKKLYFTDSYRNKLKHNKTANFLTVFAYICLICPVGVGGPSWEQLRSTHWSAHQRRTRSIISNLIKFAIPRESIQLDDQYRDLNGHHNWVCIKYAIKRFTTNHSNQINTDANNKYLMSRGEMAMKYFYYILPD